MCFTVDYPLERSLQGVQANCKAQESLILFLWVNKEEQEGGEGGQDEDKRELPTSHTSCLDNLPDLCSSAIEHEVFIGTTFHLGNSPFASW